MRKIKDFINNLKLENKLLSIFLLIEILFAVIAFVGGYRVIVERYEKLLFETARSSSGFFAYELEKELKDVQTLTEAVRVDTSVQQILNNVNDPVPGSRENYPTQLYSVLQQQFLEYKHDYIRHVSIRSQRIHVSATVPRQSQASEAFLQSLTSVAEDGKGSPVFVTDTPYSNCVFLVREIRDIRPPEFKNLGSIFIEINLEQLFNDLSRISNSFSNSYWLLYDEDRLIYSPPGISETSVHQIEALNTEYDTVSLNGAEFFRISGTINTANWKYILLIDYQDVATAKQFAFRQYLLILSAGLVFSFLLVHLMIRRITKHLDFLTIRMQQFGSNSSLELTPAPYDYTLRKDEIGILHRQFENMASKIHELIEQNYRQQILTKEAQLKSLEAQMNPHFLYNTLESINWRAKANHDEATSHIAESLGHFLRMTLNAPDNFYTIEDEMSIIHDYMTIQQLRFEQRMEFEVNVPASCLDACIPKLCIQPLLENAVHYGLEQISDVCEILLEITHQNGQLYIEVRNSDSEFPENLLERLRTHELKENGLGIALLNIDERIKLRFGTQYGLSFHNEGNYAIVRLHIPYESQNA